jgi:hypothetical protein
MIPLLMRVANGLRIKFDVGARLTYESGINDQLLLEDGASFLLYEPN